MPKAAEGENDAALQADLSVEGLFGVSGKVALVTGGGSGIGAMIAAGFVQNGCKVYVASRKDTTEYSAALTKQGPGTCHSIVCDVSDHLQIQNMMEDLKRREGKLHILVNNSGTNYKSPIGQHDMKMFQKVMQLNANAVFDTVQEALPLLEAAATKSDPARVINISSVNGITPPLIDIFAYGTSKAGVIMLSKHLAGTLGSRNITVNTLCPGPFMSRIIRGMVKEEGPEHLVDATALSRMGRPDDIAGACLFLSSRAGSYVTGTEFAVDGGSLIARAPMPKKRDQNASKL
mmetsp:Transcript_11784/g.25526  ORF Transcript_11784/g.25526 Transcript_11784/m.25526 type:complete len:290 (-) Transcript_11784:498-1367(-)